VVSEYEGSEVSSAELKQEDYRSKPLGRFIEDELLKGAKMRKGSYAAESETISDKTTFCQKALAHLTRFKDLSVEAQELTKRLYQFIEQENSR